MRVIFQSMNSNLFRAVEAGYLYEIAQKHEVLLLASEIDSLTKKLLVDKNLFPGLKKIIFFESAFYGRVFSKNCRLVKTLKRAVKDYKPDIVITHTDMWPADMYLLRFAKKAGSLTIAMQSGFIIAGERKLYHWSCLMNACQKMPAFLPFSFRLLLVKIKKYIGHFLYYWVLPTTAGQVPFLGKTSFIFWDDALGLRDADYAVVFSKRDYDLCVKEGADLKKIFIGGHPLEHPVAKEFFKKTYFSKNKEPEREKTLTIMLSDEKIGFREKDHSLILKEELRKNRNETVALISEKLAGWKIFIKPHPAVKTISEAKELVGKVPDNVHFVDPQEPADKYIEMSRVVVGFPPPSTTIFSASKHSPKKIVLSLNLNNELLGDAYKNFEDVDYIGGKDELKEALDLISVGKYYNKSNLHFRKDFLDTNELLEHVYENSLRRR